MTAVRVRGDFSRAWQVGSGRARRRAAEQKAAASAAAAKRYPSGRIEGREPFAAALDTLLEQVGVSVREWRDDRRGFAYLGSPDKGISIPAPVDAETTIVALHEGLHHAVDHQAHRDEAVSWRGEVDCWRGALRWYRRSGLPDVAKAEQAAVERLRTRPEARRFRPATLNRALNGKVGSPILETPRASLQIIRGYG